jgi:hypothetical protein
MDVWLLGRTTQRRTQVTTELMLSLVRLASDFYKMRQPQKRDASDIQFKSVVTALY